MLERHFLRTAVVKTEEAGLTVVIDLQELQLLRAEICLENNQIFAKRTKRPRPDVFTAELSWRPTGQ